jgi:DNA-binding CsgD family transcriptional regulator
MATLDQFSNLVLDIYDAALDPGLWDQTLKRVFSLAGGNNAALVLYDREKRRSPHIIAANFDPVQKRKYDEYYSRLDPLAFILERSRVGAVVTSRTVTNETQRRGEFYTDWAHPNETGDTIFVNILAAAGTVCTFMMGHPWCSEPFATPEVLRLVGLLAPHLQRSMQAQLDFGRLTLVKDGALDLVDQWRHGCVLVSLTGSALYANRAANEIAASRDGLSLGAGGLKAAQAADDSALQRLIRQACTGNGQGPRSGSRLAMSRGSGRKPYTIQVLPLRSSCVCFGGGPAAALILIIDHGAGTHLSPAELRGLYNLTPAEAEVALLVLRGHGLQLVADELRVSLSTVRVHLQRVFEKTRTHRQAELVRLLIELDASNVTASIPRKLPDVPRTPAFLK